MTKKERKKQKIGDKIISVASIVIGAVLWICNMFKITPGIGSPMAIAITTIIAYGMLFGMGFIVIGASGLLCNE